MSITVSHKSFLAAVALWLIPISCLRADLEDGLIVHFKLDEGFGSKAYNDVTISTFATLINFPIWLENGLFFNGVNQYVKSENWSGNLHGSNQLSIAAWIKPARANTWDGIVTKGTEKAPYTLGMHSGGRLIFGANVFDPPGGNGWATAESTSSVPLNTWSHVAVTYDGAKVRFTLMEAWIRNTIARSPLVRLMNRSPLGEICRAGMNISMGRYAMCVSTTGPFLAVTWPN